MARERHIPSHRLARRGVLKAAGAVGAAAVGGAAVLATRETAGASVSPRTGNYRIDVHCHIVPDFYRESLDAAGVTDIGGLAIPDWSPELAVSFMNRYGIQTQVVSVSEPGVEHMTTSDKRMELAQRVNDYLSKDLVHTDSAKFAGRFGGFGVLPLSDIKDSDDVQNAVTEVKRAMGELKLDGIGIFSSYHGVYLGDPLLDPLMETLDDLGAMVFIHPATPQHAPGLGLPAFLYEFTFDTTRALVNMLYKKTYVNYPRIRWIGAHAGGTLPFLSYRTSLLYSKTVGLAQTLGLDGLDDANVLYRKLFFDTALSPVPQSMKSTRELAGVGHIMFASDWPFTAELFPAAGDPAPQLDETFSSAERLRVERSNALAQLPRVAARLLERST
ncbi:amidohydrolase [Streptomyces sp. TUS-ST3]|uniref:amidohydrolase family protein n=1 Tax=Streptomyces sp. TUS-ST3 TaxID=3025591 RepID=UPI00235B46AB|nr:amidohydrolase family protein [Streptomyces sp. TUS-ST3]GLP66468.1 amidohydrolase [Streptomyces sp. TUS-ST3]